MIHISGLQQRYLPTFYSGEWAEKAHSVLIFRWVFNFCQYHIQFPSLNHLNPPYWTRQADLHLFPSGIAFIKQSLVLFFWKKFSPQSSSYTTNPVYSQRLKLRHFFFLLCRETEWGQEEEPVFIFWSVPWRGCQNRWQGARERWKEKGRGRGEKWGRSKLQAGWQSQGLSVTLQPCMVFARGAALHPAELPRRQAPGEVLSPL